MQYPLNKTMFWRVGSLAASVGVSILFLAFPARVSYGQSSYTSGPVDVTIHSGTGSTGQPGWTTNASYNGTNTLTETGTFGTASSTTNTTANGAEYFQVADFTPLLHDEQKGAHGGQLTGVTIEVSAQIGTLNDSYQLKNNRGGSHTFSFEGSLNLELFTPGTTTANAGTAAGTILANGNPTVTGALLSNIVVAAGGTSTASNTSLADANSTAINAVTGTGVDTLAAWSGYNGSSNMFFNASGLITDIITETDGSNSGTSPTDESTWLTTDQWTADVSINVTYTYVPEPGTWAMMASLVTAGGLTLRRRRRRTVSAH